MNPWLWRGAELCGLTWDERRASYPEIEITTLVIPIPPCGRGISLGFWSDITKNAEGFLELKAGPRNDDCDGVARDGNKFVGEQGNNEVDRCGRCAVGR